MFWFQFDTCNDRNKKVNFRPHWPGMLPAFTSLAGVSSWKLKIRVTYTLINPLLPTRLRLLLYSTISAGNQKLGLTVLSSFAIRCYFSKMGRDHLLFVLPWDLPIRFQKTIKHESDLFLGDILTPKVNSIATKTHFWEEKKVVMLELELKSLPEP